MVNDWKSNWGMVAGKDDKLVLDKRVELLRDPTRGGPGCEDEVEEGVGEKSKLAKDSLL